MSDEQQDQVVFENIADQYVKGEDVTVHFTILNTAKINAADDFIGLLRVCLFEAFLTFETIPSNCILGWLYEHSRLLGLCTDSANNFIGVDLSRHSSVCFLIITSNR